MTHVNLYRSTSSDSGFEKISYTILDDYDTEWTHEDIWWPGDAHGVQKGTTYYYYFTYANALENASAPL